MGKFKFSVPVKTTDLVYPVQKLIQDTSKLKSIYRQEGLSVTQGQILICLDRFGAMTVMGLTTEMTLDKSTVSQTLAHMQTAGLIDLREKGEDRRYKQVSLTGAGTAKVQSINAGFDKALQRVLSSLDQKDINATGYGLMRFAELLSHLKDISFKRIMGASKAPETGRTLFNLEQP